MEIANNAQLNCSVTCLTVDELVGLWARGGGRVGGRKGGRRMTAAVVVTTENDVARCVNPCRQNEPNLRRRDDYQWVEWTRWMDLLTRRGGGGKGGLNVL